MTPQRLPKSDLSPDAHDPPWIRRNAPVVGGPAHALSSPVTASPTQSASRPARRRLRTVTPSPLAGYCLHSRRGSPVTSAHGGSRLVGARTLSSLDITSVTGLWSGTTPRTQGGKNGGMAAGNMTEALILRLALQGLPLPAGAEADDAFRLVSPILARNREQSRRLADRPCPADRRIQGFLDSYLADAPVQPQLPRRTLVLDQPGLARQLSLPRDSDEFSSNLLSSYRLANGVLHNPASDRRTTAGVFHIAEGGLPIQDDKLAVPKATFAKLLEAALQPPADALVLPWTSTFAEPAGTWVSLLLRPLVVPATPAYPSDRTMETRFIVPGGLVANLDFVEGIFGNAGDPYLPENDASLDPKTWTGHTGCVILAPHLTGLTKKQLGLPPIAQASERQKRDGMCWTLADELYNGGQAFKACARDARGVVVTLSLIHI